MADERIDALENENALLRSALRPFADAARIFEHVHPDHADLLVHPQVPLSDYRIAAAALAPPADKHENATKEAK